MRIFSTLHLYQRWWKAWGSLPVHAWVKAASLYRAGQYREAIMLYQQGLTDHAKHPAMQCAKLDLSYCLFKTGKYSEAETYLKEIVEENPRMREACVRLANLQVWLGQSLEAAWTLHKAIRHNEPDSEMAGLFLNAVLENGGPDYLLSEAITLGRKLGKESNAHVRLKVALARLKIIQGDKGEGETELESLANVENASRDAVLAWAEQLLENGQIAQARYHLRRLMHVASDYPRVLSLLAQSYLVSGPFYNIEFATQLATTACQNTEWASPREMYVLAEAYYHSGDKMSALLVASKAKDAGNRLLGTYPEAENLDALLETLNAGTLG